MLRFIILTFLGIFANMEPFSKTLLLPQIASKLFQTSPEFLSQTPSQGIFFGFLKCCIFFKFYDSLKF